MGPAARRVKSWLCTRNRGKGQSGLKVCYQCQNVPLDVQSRMPWISPPIRSCGPFSSGCEPRHSRRSIWLCTACETCSTRCPQEVDPAGVMDALRHIAYAEGIKSPEMEIPLFHRIFLGTVAPFGRVFS